MIGFTDASIEAFGVVIYIRDNRTNRVSFLLAKNRLLNEDMRKKFIPALELQGISFGVETIQDTRESLCGKKVMVPVKIDNMEIHTDSMVCLHWLQKYALTFEKQQKLSVFASNRLRTIDESCRKFPITFYHIKGEINTADYVTKPHSYKRLSPTFYSGPEFLKGPRAIMESDISVTIPNPNTYAVDEVPTLNSNHAVPSNVMPDHEGRAPPDAGECGTSQLCHATNTAVSVVQNEHLIQLSRYSRLSKLVAVHRNVLRFCNNLKTKINTKRGYNRYKILSNEDLYNVSLNYIIKCEQNIRFPEVMVYMLSKNKHVNKIPNLVTQLNLYLDDNGVLRVKAKFDKGTLNPILLPKFGELTKLIIKEAHERLGHSGIYAVLKELRSQFWIIHFFSVVKKALRECIICRRMNAQPVRINQNSYRNFR